MEAKAQGQFRCQVVFSKGLANLEVRECASTSSLGLEPLNDGGASVCERGSEYPTTLNVIYGMMTGLVRDLQDSNEYNFGSVVRQDGFHFYEDRLGVRDFSGVPSREAMQMIWEEAFNESAPDFFGFESRLK